MSSPKRQGWVGKLIYAVFFLSVVIAEIATRFRGLLLALGLSFALAILAPSIRRKWAPQWERRYAARQVAAMTSFRGRRAWARFGRAMVVAGLLLLALTAAGFMTAAAEGEIAPLIGGIVAVSLALAFVWLGWKIASERRPVGPFRRMLEVEAAVAVEETDIARVMGGKDPQPLASGFELGSSGEPQDSGSETWRLAIAVATCAAWLAGSVFALRVVIGSYPPITTQVVLSAGTVLATLVGRRVGRATDPRNRWSLGVLTLAGALLLPSWLVTTVPGLKQLQTWPLPGRPTLAISAAPDGSSNIYLIREGGADIVQLTDRGTATQGADLSPDGRRIVFSDSREGTSDLYLMHLDAAGTPVDIRRLTDDLGNELGPRWSPDGTRIVYQRVFERSSDVFVLDPLGGEPTRLTTDAYSWNPSWWPDGESLVFSSPNPNDAYNLDLWILTASGHRRHLLDSGGDDYLPSVSPDGRRILFTSDVAGSPDVWVANADGEGARRVTPESPDEDLSVGWSEDGRHILFLSDRSRSGGVFLYFVPVGGGEARLAVIL